MKRLGILFNLLCSVTVVFLPLALYIETGIIKYSFSVYHDTEASYILLIGLLLVGLSYAVSDNVISGLLLIGVASFNTYDFTWTHNIVAGLFFIYTTYNIIKDKRFNYLALPVISAAFLIPAITLFWFESVAVLCFAIHSILYSLKKLKIYK